MSILDTPFITLPNAPIWKTVVRYGLLCSVALILIAQISYYLGYMPVTIADTLLYLAIYLMAALATAFLAVRRQRNLLDGGYIPFRKALLIGALSANLGIFILETWNWFFARFLAPDYSSHLKQLLQAYWSGKIPAESLHRMLRSVDEMQSLVYVLWYTAIYAIPISLVAAGIAALFLSRKSVG